MKLTANFSLVLSCACERENSHFIVHHIFHEYIKFCLQYIIIVINGRIFSRERFHCVSEVLRVQHQLGYEHRVVSANSSNQICKTFRGRNLSLCPAVVLFITSTMRETSNSSSSCAVLYRAKLFYRER